MVVFDIFVFLFGCSCSDNEVNKKWFYLDSGVEYWLRRCNWGEMYIIFWNLLLWLKN